jgi:septation ring formation regulator EzrA
MAQRNLKETVGRPLAPDLGATALKLVYQAAEIFSSMEDHARETEARAYSICKSAAEGLDLAEKRIEAAECARREADCELLEMSRALKQAQSRIEAAEDMLTALESRAQAAEAEARETKKALALIEEAIRTRLLRASPEDESSLGDTERNSVSSGRLSV